MFKSLLYTNYHKEPLLLATRFGISNEAAQLYLNSDIIDLHADTYLWKRLIGYDLKKRHDYHPLGLPFIGQVDYPRCIEANMAGICWDIVANPIIPPFYKLKAVRKQIDSIIRDISEFPRHFKHVRTYEDYVQARKKNLTACWISIQGGQALDSDLSYLDKIPEILKITLIHFTKSNIGASSVNPFDKKVGLSRFGQGFIERMIDNRIIVDLAHINEKGFWDAVETINYRIPFIVSHSGVRGVHNIWRNLSDTQLKAIAKANGVIGLMYQAAFLAPKKSDQTMDKILDHMEHIFNIIGDDYVALGSDYDGMVILPRGFKTILDQPILVHKMLSRNWSHERIQKILSSNFLRVLKSIRPD